MASRQTLAHLPLAEEEEYEEEEEEEEEEEAVLSLLLGNLKANKENQVPKMY